MRPPRQVCAIGLSPPGGWVLQCIGRGGLWYGRQIDSQDRGCCAGQVGFGADRTADRESIPILFERVLCGYILAVRPLICG